MARRTQIRLRRVGRFLPPYGDEFASVEALGGLVLLAGAAIALVWANLDPSSYLDTWSRELSLGVGSATLELSWRSWITDGLMTVFFFVVALEIKREVVKGELRDRRRARLPVLAALGGMVVPAAIFAALNAGGAGGDGWAIPMATDIAFALGVLALLGTRVPTGARLFLLTLAIVDDLGAILVVAVFYTDHLAPEWLIGIGASVAAVLAMRRWGVRSPWWYVLPAVPLWISVHEVGIHATIAGVILGLLTPVGLGPAQGPLERLERGLHPWSSFVVVPLFAIANAGVVLDSNARDQLGGRITLGILLGLVVGKIVGVAGVTALAARFRLGRLPEGVAIRDIVGIGMVAGIGFTVSLFVARLSFSGPQLDAAKVAILGASVLAGALGVLWFRIVGRARR